jgi:hypothetical protein
MEKLDLKKQLKHLYRPSAKKPSIVEVPPMNFLMIDGQGHPNESEDYHACMQALYGLSYTIKFASKLRLGVDYVVMALEGLWWTGDTPDFREDEGAWKWTSMIMQPEHITAQFVEEAREELAAKKDPPALDRVRFQRFEEGLSAQIMHVGPYDAEGPTIERLHVFISENGYQLRGRHHEIYLGDPRRTAPERLKTVLRQPVRPEA